MAMVKVKKKKKVSLVNGQNDQKRQNYLQKNQCLDKNEAQLAKIKMK